MEYCNFLQRIEQARVQIPPNTEVHRILDYVRGTYARLFGQLYNSGNIYHNIEHAVDVYERLMILIDGINKNKVPKSEINPKKIILMGEGALRHDVGHTGHTIRQDSTKDTQMSNEELAVYITEMELMGISREDVLFLSRLILATSFGQNGFPKTDFRYRDYSPKTLEENLLVFADIGGGVMNGWEYFLDESMRVLHESQKLPGDISEWIEGRKKFINYVVIPQYEKIKRYLKSKLQKTIESNIQNILGKLGNLDNPNEIEDIYKRMYSR